MPLSGPNSGGSERGRGSVDVQAAACGRCSIPLVQRSQFPDSALSRTQVEPPAVGETALASGSEGGGAVVAGDASPLASALAPTAPTPPTSVGLAVDGGAASGRPPTLAAPCSALALSRCSSHPLDVTPRVPRISQRQGPSAARHSNVEFVFAAGVVGAGVDMVRLGEKCRALREAECLAKDAGATSIEQDPSRACCVPGSRDPDKPSTLFNLHAEREQKVAQPEPNPLMTVGVKAPLPMAHSSARTTARSEPCPRRDRTRSRSARAPSAQSARPSCDARRRRCGHRRTLAVLGGSASP